MASTLDQFCDHMIRSRLLSAQEATAVRARWSEHVGDAADDVKRFAKWLITQKHLTPYQAERLVRGQTEHFFFGDYKILGVIKQGRFRGAYQAVNAFGEVAIVRILPPYKSKDSGLVKHLVQAAERSVDWNHPNLLRVLRADTCNGLYYLLCENVTGESLADILERRKILPSPEALALVAQSLKGLQYLHEQGASHGGLDPENLFITPAPGKEHVDSTYKATVRIVDAGVRRDWFDPDADNSAARPVNTEAAVASSPYRAPEVDNDEASSDIRSDIFSIGCILYRCLTGAPPGAGVQSFGAGEIEHKDEINGIIAKFVAIDPNDRFADPKHALKAIRKIFEKSNASATTEGALDDDAADGKQLEREEDNPPMPVRPLRTGRRRDDEPDREEEASAREVRRSKRPEKRRRLRDDADEKVEREDPKVEIAPIRAGKRRIQRETDDGDEETDEEQERQRRRVAAVEEGESSGWQLALSPRLLAIGGGALLVLFVVILIISKSGTKPPTQDPGLISIQGPKGADTVIQLPPPTTSLTEIKPPSVDWLQAVAGMLPEQQPAAVEAKLRELNTDFRGPLKHEIQDGVVTDVQFLSDNVTNVSPLRALPGLRRLNCAGSGPSKGRLADLTPLRGMNLLVLECSDTNVIDLAPLQGMPLVYLGIARTPVRDLSPLAESPLMGLCCASAPIVDLTPLAGKKLLMFDAGDCAIDNLSPLRGMPLQALWCSIRPLRDQGVLRSLASLKRVNDKPVNDIWREAQNEQQLLDAWSKQVAALPADKRADAVAVELKKRNPDFDGKLSAKIDGGEVVELRMVTDAVTDLWPIRALPGLRRLHCPGSQPGKSRLTQLEALRGLKLIELDCAAARIMDLSPLTGMPLTHLTCSHNPVLSDLSTLQNLPLQQLTLENCTGLKNIALLSKLPLKSLVLTGTRVADLSPIAGMTLDLLSVDKTNVTDFAPLRQVPLKLLNAQARPERDLELLRQLSTLEKINNRPAGDFLKELQASHDAFTAFLKRVASLPAADQVKEVAEELKKRNPDFDGNLQHQVDLVGVVTECALSADQVTDVWPLKAMTGLRKLICAGTAPGKGLLEDVTAFRDAGIFELDLSNNQVRDLAVFQSLKRLSILNLAGSPVDNLGPLRKLPLKSLNILQTRVTSLEPLREVGLKELQCDSALEHDYETLSAMETLTTINGRPAATAVGAVRTAPDYAALRGDGNRRQASQRFNGEVVQVNPLQRTFSLKVSAPILVQNAYNAHWLGYNYGLFQQYVLLRDTRERLNRVAEHLYWAAWHRANLYRWQAKNQEMDLALGKDVAIHTLRGKDGKIVNATPQEIESLAGADGKLPGSPVDVSMLGPQQNVRVQLILMGTNLASGAVPAVGDTTARPAQRDQIDPRPLVTRILIMP